MRLTAKELEQMKSVDIGAVAPESLPDVSGMACNFGYGPFLLRDKVSRGGGILVVPPGQRYNIDVM